MSTRSGARAWAFAHGVVLLGAVGSGVACQPGELDPSTAAGGERRAALVDGTAVGTYLARIASLHDGGTRISHHLILGADDDGLRPAELELALPVNAAADAVPYARGTWLQIEGAPLGDGRFAVDELVVLAPPAEPLIEAEPFDPRVLATILLFWDEPGLSNGNADQSMFSGAEATSVFYGEASYGRERVVGEVFGPYQIDDPGFCNTLAIADDAQQAMLDKGHNPADYRQLMYHFPATGCDFAGLADLGAPQFPARESWYHDAFGCVVRNQELGHNYGMGHSHAYDCGTDAFGNDIVFSAACEHIEYGDPYDPMGDGCAHMNAVQKAFMGWIDGCNVVRATADATFNLLPLELPCNGTQALRFPAFDGRDYYLEYRRPIGEFDGDAGLDGVVVHVAGDGGFAPSPYFLDIGGDGLMQAGDTYTDPEGSVSFTVVALHDSHAVVAASFPGGGSGEPLCSDGTAPALVDGAIGALECAAAPYPADDTPPTVTITYPADGAQFEAGADFTVTAEASDDRILSDLELYLDSSPQVRLFAEPWAWDVTNIPAGEYVFGVVARDGRNMGISQTVTVIVEAPAADTTGAVDDTGDASSGDAEGSSSGGASQDTADGGCGCTHARNRGTAAPWLLLGVLAARRRRRLTAGRSAR